MIAYVDVGTPVEMVSSALGGAVFQGKVTFVGNAAIDREQSPAGSASEFEDPSGLKVFELGIELESSPDELRPGMTVDLSIVRQQLEDAVSIPLRAVYRQEGLPVVFVETPEGPRSQPVVLGAKNRERVVVLDGLEGGERLYLADLNQRLEELKKSRGKQSSGANVLN